MLASSAWNSLNQSWDRGLTKPHCILISLDEAPCSFIKIIQFKASRHIGKIILFTIVLQGLFALENRLLRLSFLCHWWSMKLNSFEPFYLQGHWCIYLQMYLWSVFLLSSVSATPRQLQLSWNKFTLFWVMIQYTCSTCLTPCR